MRPGWANDPIHAAGGRRHYNSVRQFRAELRRIEIICFLAESHISLFVRGTQRALAEKFGVSEATISRDLVRIFAKHTRDRHCPFCGAKPLDEKGCALSRMATKDSVAGSTCLTTRTRRKANPCD